MNWSWSESHATAVTVAGTCPKYHTCQLQATTQMLHVKGFEIIDPQASIWKLSRRFGVEEIPFEEFYPITVPGAAKDSEALVNFSICTIGNRKSCSYPVCPSALEPRPAACDALGASMENVPFHKTCRG